MESLIIKVVTLGCKVNQCESASIVAALRSSNYNASEGLAPADVYILNTCSVTAEADKKSRQYVTKMIKLNPRCHIIVVGCSSQNKPQQFSKNNVFAVGGTANKVDFVVKSVDLLFKNHYNTLSDRIVFDKNIGKIAQIKEYCCENYPISDKTRAFIKIQDGCNRFCTYCIIPYLRGRSRSRPIRDIVDECKLIDSKEIVITGIDMSSYGTDIGTYLPALITAMGEFGARKRLGSLECEVIDDRLLSAMKQGDFCPHFHLSLQSGNDTVLKSMNRKYDCDLFLNKVELIRKYYPTAAITTDIIVGFPTETDELFDNSVQFINRCAFSDIHVFPYSSREGTLASRKYKTLPPDVVKSRVDRLLAVKRSLHKNFLDGNLGAVLPVYVEDTEGEYNVGYTPNYIKVYSNAPCGEIVDLKLTELYSDGVIGV